MKILSVIWIVLFCATLIFAGSQEAAAPKPGEKDRCAVCGMPVASFTNWISSVVFKDGTTSFFDGPKDMFQFLFDVPKYRKNATRQDIAKIFVTSYYTLQPIKAEEAFFVIGSDVAGPMGPEIVPFQTEKEASAFLKDHNGKQMVKFNEITPEVLAGIK